jgi:hypothetical protein
MATLRPFRISSSTSRDSSATRALWALPGVGHAQDLSDGALAVHHQPVDLSEHIADLVEVVLGRQPGAGEEPVVVRAALAVDEHELDGGGGGELAHQVSDEHGLAEPG